MSNTSTTPTTPTKKGLLGWLDRLFVAIPLRMLAIIGAGFIANAILSWIIWDFMYGHWTTAAESQRIRFLGWYGFLEIAVNGIVVAALTSQKIKGTGPAGLAFEIEGAEDNSVVSPKITTTTTTEVTPNEHKERS